MPEGLTVVQHPVLDDRLAVLRDAATPHSIFRQALSEASAILAVESTRDLPTVAHTIDTPLEPALGRVVDDAHDAEIGRASCRERVSTIV